MVTRPPPRPDPRHHAGFNECARKRVARPKTGQADFQPSPSLDGDRSEHIKLCGTAFVRIMKTNVTLKLDRDLLTEVRIIAAEEGSSLSALLGERLESLVQERKAYDRARRRALARLRSGLDLHWTPPASRDDLHER